MRSPTPEAPPGPLRQALGKTFLSLRHRNFRLFFIGQTISNSGNWLTNVALTLLLLKLTQGSGVAIGWLAACQYGPIFLLSAWAGAFADRYDKRQMLLGTQSLEMAQSIGLAALAFTHHPARVGIYVLAVFGGILLAFDNPLRRSFVTEMVPKEDIPNAVVLYSTIVNVSRIFGPALAGLLAVTVGYGWCFTLDAASYVAVLACLFLMRPEELFRQPRKPQTKGAVGEGIRYVLSVPTLWVSFAMFAVIGLLACNFNVTLPLFVTGPLHSNERTFTLLYSTFSGGAVTCALIVAHRGLVGIRHILFGAVALGGAMLLLSIVPHVALAVPAVFLIGMTSILYTTATTAIIQVEGKPEMQGRVLALQTVLIGGSAALGGPLLGWVADSLGARWLMIIGSFSCFVAAAFGYFIVRHRTNNSDRF